MTTGSFWNMIPVVCIILLLVVLPCSAVEPLWNYSHGDRKILDVAVAQDGSDVIAATGKVLLLSRDGTVLANEPFGDTLTQSRDGSAIVTTYSSNVASTAYLFRRTTGKGGMRGIQKAWEAPLSYKVTSVAVSDGGNRVILSNGGKGIDVYDGKTGTHAGDSDTYSSLVAVSAKGYTIAGISSTEGLRRYTFGGALADNYDISLPGAPTSFLMDANGTFVVANAGPHIAAFFTNGSEIWRRDTSGDVNALAMTPSGNVIIAGTGNGTIERYDSGGNLTWSYFSSTSGGTGQAIEAVAVSTDGSKILAGAEDGKIILLDWAGNPIWIFSVKYSHIMHTAIAGDGSLAVAAGENTIYAFPTGQQKASPTASPQNSPVQTFSSSLYSGVTTGSGSAPAVTREKTRTIVPDSPMITETEYSVIRKGTQSPVELLTGVTALLVIVFLAVRNKR